MARVKRGVVSRRKHNKLHDLVKGYRGTKHRLIKTAHRRSHAGALHIMVKLKNETLNTLDRSYQ
jgi:ribosomal protein L20